MYSQVTSLFLTSTNRIIRCVFTFLLYVTPVMSSAHALGHVTNSEKMQRLPGKFLYLIF